MRRFIVMGGQSNMRGAGGASFAGLAPAGIPHASIRYAAINDSQRFGPGSLIIDPNDNHFGPECQMGVDLYDAGWTDLVIAKAARDGQPIREFMPGGTYYWHLKDAILRAMPAAGATGSTRFYFGWSQGEAESIEVAETNALLWASNYNTLHGIVAGWLGVNPARLGKVIALCPSGFHTVLGDSPWKATVRAQQTSAADIIINQDDAPLQADESHLAPAWYNTIGSRFATAFLSL